MKAALNGGLNLVHPGTVGGTRCSNGENGWAIPSAAGVADPARRDELEAAAFYNLVETQVAPRFYARDAGGRADPLGGDGPAHAQVRSGRRCWPAGWCATTSASCTRRPPPRPPGSAGTITPVPGEAGPAGGPGCWPPGRTCGVQHVESSGVGDTPELGATLSLRAEVELGGLAPAGRVRAGRVRAGGPGERVARRADGVHEPTSATGPDCTSTRGPCPLERTGSFGYTVRVLPDHDLLATHAELGVVTVAS